MAKQVLHLAGIVPIAGKSLEFKMPWNDSLMPIAPNYLAAERAVYECALAGCESIWVVCHVGTEPLLRKRLGDYIADPVSLTSGLNKTLRRRDISIFYIPIHPKHKNRRDSLSWSILYGADNAFRISAYLSKWIIPKKFYCAFPYGILPDNLIKKNRKKISSEEKTLFTFNNKSIIDNYHISFTFNEEEYKKAKNKFKNIQVESWDHLNKKNLSDFNLTDVFSDLDIDRSHTIETPWFYDISTWQGYVKFLSSEHNSLMVKNYDCFLKDKRIRYANKQEIILQSTINTLKMVEKPDIESEVE